MQRTITFMMAALGRPGTVGAVLPASSRLADAMARAAAGGQRLIDLGAGTGAITAALCRQHPGVPILAVELKPELAHLLRRRFTGIEVRAAAAHEVLLELPPGPAATVLVSSLPFRSLPPPLRMHSILAIERALVEQRARCLVQYTYLPSEPFATSPGSPLVWRRLDAVWCNLPPAWVWALSLRGPGA